jgi:hypothetical protein
MLKNGTTASDNYSRQVNNAVSKSREEIDKSED